MKIEYYSATRHPRNWKSLRLGKEDLYYFNFHSKKDIIFDFVNISDWDNALHFYVKL